MNSPCIGTAGAVDFGCGLVRGDTYGDEPILRRVPAIKISGVVFERRRNLAIPCLYNPSPTIYSCSCRSCGFPPATEKPEPLRFSEAYRKRARLFGYPILSDYQKLVGYGFPGLRAGTRSSNAAYVPVVRSCSELTSVLRSEREPHPSGARALHEQGRPQYGLEGLS